IHRASTASAGNSDDLASDLQGLDATDQAIVNVYADKTGLDKQTIYKMMSDATWINAETAIKRGFADEIMFTDQATTITNNTGQMLLNKDAIAKVKTLIHKNKQQNNVEKNKKIEDELSQLKEKKLAILLSK
ncbi:ATP-dependent Clp protease proteolytic subunit, partial [Melissococcus plutonius]